MAADPGIQADTLNDLPGIEALHLRIGIQLIEEGHPESKIGIGEQLHRFRFREAHEQGINIFLDGALLQQGCKGFRRLYQARILRVGAYDDAGGIEVVVQSLALPQELGAEEDVLCSVFLPDHGGKAHRNGGLDNHNGIGIVLQHQPDHGLNSTGVEEILLGIIVGRRCDHHEVSVFVGFARVQGGCQIQLLFCQIFFKVFVLDGGSAAVDRLHLFRDDVYSGNGMVLGQQYRNGQTHIAGTGYRDLVFFHK